MDSRPLPPPDPRDAAAAERSAVVRYLRRRAAEGRRVASADNTRRGAAAHAFAVVAFDLADAIERGEHADPLAAFGDLPTGGIFDA
jgi:hypothetical protein